MNYYLKQKNGGEESINLVPLEPLNIKKTTIKQGTDSRLSVELTLSNSQGYGLNTVEVYKVKGFHSDLTKQHEISFKMDKGSIIGNYEVNGRFFFFPINGRGKSNMTIVNSDVILKFNGTSYKKNGGTYMKVENIRIRLNPGRVYFNFENLFNSDKELSNNMNLFLNENWREIFIEMQDSVNKVYSDIYSEIITKVFSKFFQSVDQSVN
ncbi:protein takeout-like [Teleopsis dalmanni]|nr:protein takeout-like [Teleopsis dalmanni]